MASNVQMTFDVRKQEYEDISYKCMEKHGPSGLAYVIDECAALWQTTEEQTRRLIFDFGGTWTNPDSFPFCCWKCDKVEPGPYMDSIRSVLLKNKLCHTCNHFHEICDAQGTDTNHVCINGVVYYIGDEDAKFTMRGFGGAKYVICFNDGRMVTTTNLWDRGAVPAQWKAEIPDNAIWYKRQSVSNKH